MLHYSNWLIGVKNRASLRNASKTPPSPDCNNRGNTVDVQNNNPLPSEKAAAFAVTNHLLGKGKTVQRTQRLKGHRLVKISGPTKKHTYPFLASNPLLPYAPYHLLCTFANDLSSLFGCAKVKFAASFPSAPRVREEGEGVLRYQGDGQRKGSLADWRR